ncbi:MAG: PKD domain-containing protein [Thermoanaerobaculia bacterium]
MNFFGSLFKGVSAVVASLLALGLFSGAAAPTASFKMTPDGNPVMGQTVQFSDTSTGSPTSWSWNFGDGQSSTQQSPTHVYGGPGPFTVTLTATNSDGPSSPKVQPVIVSPSDTLRLNAGHPFLVKLVATNQHNNNVQGPGQAIPQNDLFGYFSLPSLTGDPNNPEVFVKILDGRPINGQFWVFYGHLTDLIYDITVTEVATGLTKTYHKNAGNSAGGFDTSGFNPAATPTPTVIPTPTPTPSGSATWIVNVGQSGNSFRDTQSGSAFTSIRVGDTVKWVFVSSMPHSTTSGTCMNTGGTYGEDICTADGLWNSNEMVSPSTFSHTFTSAGTYKYYCLVHGYSMQGTVLVGP